MADKANHIKQFTAQDIERYYSGQMPVQEMHQLEKAALDDPFLADALEGYAYTKTPHTDLADIRKRLEEKQKDRKPVPMQQSRFLWLKVAAAVFVLVTAGWLFYQTTDNTNNKVALKQQFEKESTAGTEMNKQPFPGTDTNANTVDVNKERYQTANKTHPANSGVSTKERSALKDDIALRQEVENKKTDEVAYQNRNTIVDSNYFRNNVVMSNPVASGPSQPRANFYNGRVVDNYNRAVTNATIVANNNLSVRTDKQGVFTFPAQDSIIDATVKAKGFQSNQTKLNADEPVVIVLQPLQNVMQEVVVIPRRKQDSSVYARKRSILADTIEPIDGWTAFEDYIDSNLVTVGDLVKTNEGEVELSFDVNPSGEPVNIKVVRSLCVKCDEEAIRLLKEGPKWVRKKNKKGKVTIKF